MRPREGPVMWVVNLLNRGVAAGLVSILTVGLAPPAVAYRPFDGTDAAVAEPEQLEIELGPAEFLWEGSDRTLFAPNLRLTYGLAEKWQFTLEGLVAYQLSSESNGTSLVGNEALIKGVLREGSLQNKSGPSIATEFGLLLPGINDDHGTGATLTGIISQQWPWMTVHLNVEGTVTRDQHGDLFLDAILEGPHDWTVRPVAEIFHEREFGSFRETSGLLGAIWQVRDNIAVDAGFRRARLNDLTVNEIRAGVTFSFAKAKVIVRPKRDSAPASRQQPQCPPLNGDQLMSATAARLGTLRSRSACVDPLSNRLR
jgi:hypothetical protein